MRLPPAFVLLGICALSLMTMCQNPSEGMSVQSLQEVLIHENDKILATYLERQNMDHTSSFYGGFPNRHDIYNPGSAAAIMQRLVAGYVSESSLYFQDTSVLQRMDLAMDFLLSSQHPDGTIDLLTTNFHSTPDLAFAIEPTALSYKVLAKNNDPATIQLREKLKQFLLRGGQALSTGGIHTPNHRWVVCMALARLYELFPSEDYKVRVDAWLNEGIDIDQDGQYTERSTSVYSPLTNRCLLTVARIMGREDLYEDVRSNLSMSVFYMHPNGDVVTEASRRQDQYQAQSPHAYYYPYRYMSLLDHDTIFGAMVHTLEQELEPSRLSGNLIYFLEDPALSRRVPGGTLPMKYIRHFSHSDLVRIRDADTDATILAKNPAFFTMQKGGTVVQAVRFASAFFGKGQFVADTLIVQNGVFTLIQKLEGPYYQLFPIDSIPNDASWEKMPRDNRPTSEVQQLETRIEIQRVNDLFELDFTVSGTDHVPVAIELAFRKGGRLGGTESVGEIDQAFFLGEDMGTYKMDTFSITFGPGLHEHKWTQLRGADPKLDAISVYLTGYTPFHHRLTFE